MSELFREAYYRNLQLRADLKPSQPGEDTRQHEAAAVEQAAVEAPPRQQVQPQQSQASAQNAAELTQSLKKARGMRM